MKPTQEHIDEIDAIWDDLENVCTRVFGLYAELRKANGNPIPTAEWELSPEERGREMHRKRQQRYRDRLKAKAKQNGHQEDAEIAVGPHPNYTRWNRTRGLPGLGGRLGNAPTHWR